MRNILKKIGLSTLTLGLCCFVVSCDEDESAGFDYQYDGLTSVPTVELDLETAKKIQRTGTIEEVAVAKAELAPETTAPVAADNTAEGTTSTDMGMDTSTSSGDPNGF